MTNKKKVMIPISIMLMGLGVVTTILNHKKFIKVNEKTDSAKEDIKSVLRYQEERNNQIDSELDELRNEVACCYEHFEEYTKDKNNGR